MPNVPETQHPSLWKIAFAFARIGTIGFGGGVGMLALLRQEVVARRRWITDRQLSVAVAMGQMLPGPFVSNYAEYVGYELRGLRGMLVAVAALLAPCFVLMCGLSFLYFRYGSVPLVSRMFLGVQPIVVGILAWAAWYIGRSNVRTWQAAVIAVLAFLALLLKVDVLLVVLGAGLLGIVLGGTGRGKKSEDRNQETEGGRRNEERGGKGSGAGNNRPNRVDCVPSRPLLSLALRYFTSAVCLAQAAAVAGPLWRRAVELSLVFLKVGALLFGGGFASIPFLQQQVVQHRQWLTAAEFIDGVALGQMTPGPVAITAAFIGYKVMGLGGATIATLAVFVPSFFMLWGLIHVYRRVKDHLLIVGFLAGALPAVTGMVFSAVIFIGRTALAGPAPAIVALLSLLLLVRFRLDPIWLVLGGALFGLVMS